MDMPAKGPRASIGLLSSLQGNAADGGCGLTQSRSPAALPFPTLNSFVPLNRKVREGNKIQVSIILPVYNSACWLDECLKSVLEQDFQGSIELSVFNDASKDNSINIIEKWKALLEEAGIQVLLGGNDSSQPKGVGFAKNRAVDQSSGTYLCFLDSDDVMMPQRIRLQWKAAVEHPKSVPPVSLNGSIWSNTR
uniref:UDP-GlcNAc:betaGal beta-1,3-N-acetylglucosaminyltransferase like 1 n=1 Tax=Salvator merianae TaxID=96440 RepID=A0A8D0KNQ1_SALMN